MKQLFDRSKNADNTSHVVSGLPRSGTSMMRHMLTVGGLSPLTDNARPADEDHPKGYYAFTPVTHLQDGNVAWVAATLGEVVNVLSFLLLSLPADDTYRVAFMRRAMPAILASQRHMLLRRGKEPHTISDEALAVLYENYLVDVCDWLTDQHHVSVLQVDDQQLFTDSADLLSPLNAFRGHMLDINTMAVALDPTRYRQRNNGRDGRGAPHAGARAYPGGGAEPDACGRSQILCQARDEA